MHELSVTRAIISIINSQAEENSFERVEEIKLCIGEFSDVIPRCLRDCFPIAAKGTCAENAVLTIQTLPGSFRCLDCGVIARSDSSAAPAEESEAETAIRRTETGMACCPCCGSVALRLESGREFYVDSIRVV